MALAILALASLRRPPPGGRLAASVVIGLVAMVGLLAVSGLLNEVPLTRRVGHLTIDGALVAAIATGRVSLRSAGLGLARDCWGSRPWRTSASVVASTATD